MRLESILVTDSNHRDVGCGNITSEFGSISEFFRYLTLFVSEFIIPLLALPDFQLPTEEHLSIFLRRRVI